VCCLKPITTPEYGHSQGPVTHSTLITKIPERNRIPLVYLSMYSTRAANPDYCKHRPVVLQEDCVLQVPMPGSLPMTPA
jgi:hypothetical protein